MNFEFIDMGGGFGIPYYETESTLDLPALRTALLDLIDQYCRKYPATSMIAVESGRFLVGSAGVFVARVIDVKTCRGQCFVVLDGGINVFGGYDRYAGARPTPIRVAGADDRSSETLTLCGPLCTPLDRLAANVVLPMPRIGDLIIFYLAGAYGCTASPGLFLSHGFPAEVMVMGEDLALIRRRMPPDDFFLDQCFAS
jgi:diaminopimelate decarboxylase